MKMFNYNPLRICEGIEGGLVWARCEQRDREQLGEVDVPVPAPDYEGMLVVVTDSR